jgi:hypothetical protein
MVESTKFNTEYYNGYSIRRFKKEDLVNELEKIGFKNPQFTINKYNPLNKYYLVIKK